MNVSKKLMWQQGAVAQYAEIDLIVVSSDSEGFNIVLPENISSPWTEAINFAVMLFIESYAWQQPAISKLTIQVRSIETVPSDTTLFSLAYVTFQALCSRWNIDGEQVFAFDSATGKYSYNLPGSEGSL